MRRSRELERTTHVFGGVYDVDGEGLSTESTFYDDHYVLDTTKKRWKRRDALQDGAHRRSAHHRRPTASRPQASLVAVSLTPPPRFIACCAAAGKVLYVLGAPARWATRLELSGAEEGSDARKKDAEDAARERDHEQAVAALGGRESDKSDDEDEEKDLGSTSSESDAEHQQEER